MAAVSKESKEVAALFAAPGPSKSNQVKPIIKKSSAE
jgi:hypothetical protein